ncbi:hypothetical protein XH79_02450 [Bradyrhizobium sp. CCBAU 45389]|nr:hypothetical protein [Bradyrhizobium sp. CCBAU 45389]
MSRQIEIEVTAAVDPLMRAISKRGWIDKQTVSKNCLAGAYSPRRYLAFLWVEAQRIKNSGIVCHPKPLLK